MSGYMNEVKWNGYFVRFSDFVSYVSPTAFSNRLQFDSTLFDHKTVLLWLFPLTFILFNEIISASRITLPPRNVCTTQTPICIYTNELSTMDKPRHEFQWGVSCSHPTRRRAVFSPLNYFNTTDMKTGVGFPLMLSLRRKCGSWSVVFSGNRLSRIALSWMWAANW